MLEFLYFKLLSTNPEYSSFHALVKKNLRQKWSIILVFNKNAIVLYIIWSIIVTRYVACRQLDSQDQNHEPRSAGVILMYWCDSHVGLEKSVGGQDWWHYWRQCWTLCEEAQGLFYRFSQLTGQQLRKFMFCTQSKDNIPRYAIQGWALKD